MQFKNLGSLICGDSGEMDVRDRWFFRWIIVGLQAIAIIITWNLWQARELSSAIPNVSMDDRLPPFDFAWLLLGSLALIIYKPLPGVILHSCLLLLSLVFDQVRMQPEFFSLLILMWGTLAYRGFLLIARAHLIALWFFGGFHKLLSEAFVGSWGMETWKSLFPSWGEIAISPIAIAVATGEMVLGILMLLVISRKWGARLVVLLHLGILSYLISLHWNDAVWPWNVGLSVAGLVFFYRWKVSLWQEIVQNRWLPRIAVLVIFISPLGFYIGWVNAYFAHCLYSKNTPKITFQLAAEANSESLSTLANEALNVPFPNEHKIAVRFFEMVKQPGDKMQIKDPRSWAKRNGLDYRIFTYDGEYRKQQGKWTFWGEGEKQPTEAEVDDGQIQ